MHAKKKQIYSPKRCYKYVDDLTLIESRISPTLCQLQ